MKAWFVAAALWLSVVPAGAQDSVPFAGPRPVFVPGLYETESRNSHFQSQPVKAKVCVNSADFDHFLDETLRQYQSSVDFNKSCVLGETRRAPDGFAFAMDCRGSKTIITFRFSKDLVAQTIQNLIPAHRSASSSILTMMRRVGDCPGQAPPGKETLRTRLRDASRKVRALRDNGEAITRGEGPLRS
jgi:hypothetical protein